MTDILSQLSDPASLAAAVAFLWWRIQKVEDRLKEHISGECRNGGFRDHKKQNSKAKGYRGTVSTVGTVGKD